MIAAKFGDPVIGIDIHAVALPPPASVPPTPLPHPFIGIVFDPLGAVLGAAIGLVLGGGGPVLVNGMACGNTGTSVKGLPHIPTPPGVSPHPTDAPTGNEGTLVTGSKTVHFMGSSESRTLSSVSSCGYPLNLPTSVCMSVPMGRPVLIGGPEAVDWMAAVTTAIRTKWMSNALKKLVGEGTWRNKIICALTGHPVDVMTGELIAEAIDFEIDGLIPIKWERNYRSRQTREGALGPGWTHPFDERIEEANDGVRIWLGDGRPKRYARLAPGESIWDSEERFTLIRDREGYEVRSWDGMRRRYRRVIPDARGRKVDRLALTEILDPAGNSIRLDYEGGLLTHVVDTAGRDLQVRWNKTRRIEGVYFEDKPLVRYQYDLESCLAACIDPLGHSLRYAYRGGVLVKETHKSGLAFHFEWDWEHPEGWCKRTWGENPAAATQPGQPEGVPRFIYDRRITYDPDRHFTSVEDGRGGITQYWGNAAGLVEKTMDPAGVVVTATWSDTFQKTSETDGEGNTTEWEYDARGNCVLERDALGNETRREYDTENRLLRVVDASGSQWKISWDQRRKPEWIRNPLGMATHYEHDERGRLLRSEDPMGRAMRLVWNERNDVAEVIDGDNRTTVFARDSMGQVITSRDPGGRVTRVTRDAAGRVSHLEGADGDTSWMERDEEGNVISQSDARGRTVHMKYAGLGRLIEHTDAMGYRVRLAYDTEEDLISVENQAGERYRFEVDTAGRVREEIGFDGKKFRYIYDKAGRTTRILSPDYLVTMLTRDPLGRVVGRSSKAPSNRGGLTPELEEETFEFNARGEIVSAATRSTEARFERDALGQIIREQHAHDTGDAKRIRTIDNRYDLSGLRVERDTDLGHRTRYDWDGSGLLAGMTAGPSRWLEAPSLRALKLPALDLPTWEMKITRDALGMEIARKLPGGVFARWKRDAFGRPIERQVLTGALPGSQPRDVTHVAYQWESAHQIAALIDTQRGATRFEYDPRGHLIAAMFPDGTRQLRASDAVSNIYKTPDGSDRRYGRGGRLERVGNTEYRYDGHGNLTEKILADGAKWIYRWNPAGRLDEVVRPDGKNVRFAYDALGRRVRKEFDGSVTEFVWDRDDLVHERVVSSEGVASPLTTWVFEPNTFAPAAKFEGRKRFAVTTDHLGTPTEVLSEAGELAWRAQLDIWGVPREDLKGTDESKHTGMPWRYPGQYEDRETGLYYNRFRYYDPEGGRFISDDPIGLEGGLALHAYVGDPLGWIDPDGLIKQTGRTKGGIDRMTPEWRERYGPGAMREHHLVPQEMLKDTDFTDQLKKAGIPDPRDYIDRQISRLTNAEHVQLHLNQYNQEWRDWFKRNPGFTRDEFEQEIKNAMKRHDISKASRSGKRYGCK